MEEIKKKTIKQKIKTYIPFTRCIIQESFSYKSRFYFFILANILSAFMNYFLWKAIFHSTNKSTLSGFTLKEMVVYIFMSYITANIVRQSIARQIGSDIVEGTIAGNLIKPINYKARLFFHSLGQFIYNLIFPAIFIWIGLIIYELKKYGSLSISISSVLLFLISLFLSFMIMFFFEFCFGMLAFYTTYIWGMTFIKNAILELLSGQIIPIAFFPIIVRKIFVFLPFASMNYVPVMIYMRKITGIDIFYAFVQQIVWIGILWSLSLLLWRKATRKIVILGG